MSVISSRSGSIESILKAPGVRLAHLVQRKVNFELPKNLKDILLNYEAGCDRKVYEDLICILKDAHIKDDELIELLVEVRQSISLLGPSHKILIDALLNITWTNRCSEATAAYTSFLEDLVCVHVYHCKFVIDKLVSQFKPNPEDTAEWPNGEPTDDDVNRLFHIHNVLFKFIKIVPMSSTLLVQSLSSRYPYYKINTHAHEIYLHALLQILDYAPQLRPEILSLIINKLLVLDVNAPRAQIQSYDDNAMADDPGGGMFEIDSINETDNNEQKLDDVAEHPQAHTLDVCMSKLMKYIHDTCYPDKKLDMEKVAQLYRDIVPIFEKAILPTYASHHVQFIMFYICSFKLTVMESFLYWLWQKVSNPNVAPIIRQSSVAYIASLLARANYFPTSLLTRILHEMATWTHRYIAAQDSLECANSDVRVHTVFYSVCQAMFYIVGFRHKDLVNDKKNLLFLQSLNFTKIVTCRLNPLKFGLPVVVQHFAAVTRAYQLAYCYTIIEHNSRSNLPIVHNSNRFAVWLDTFFPFDPYVLRQSGSRITPLYLHYQGSINMDTGSLSGKEDNDEDDFMDVSFPEHENQHRDKFSYSTSPGFINA